jgi:hypothetical protein
MSDRELAAYSFVEREPERDASVGPAELRTAGPEADDANMRLGLWIAAALFVVGFGGWVATRGGFDIPPRTPVATPVIAAAPPAEQPVVQATAPTTSPELGDVAPAPAAPAATTAPAAPAAPAATPPAPMLAAEALKAQPRNPIAARPARPPLLKPLAEATAVQPAEDSVIKVTPAEPAAPEPAAAPTEPAEPTGPLPETPTRENVQSALDAKRSEVLVCANGQRGVAEVDLTVQSTGAVTHAVVAGDFAGSPAGSCIARVVRTARFAPFSKPRFRVIYPFSL